MANFASDYELGHLQILESSRLECQNLEPSTSVTSKSESAAFSWNNSYRQKCCRTAALGHLNTAKSNRLQVVDLKTTRMPSLGK